MPSCYGADEVLKSSDWPQMVLRVRSFICSSILTLRGQSKISFGSHSCLNYSSIKVNCFQHVSCSYSNTRMFVLQSVMRCITHHPTQLDMVTTCKHPIKMSNYSTMFMYILHTALLLST